MRLLLITDLYPINSEIENSNPLVDFVQNWEKQGHDIRVIKPNCLIENYLKRKIYSKSGMYGKVENLNYILPFVGDIKKKIKTLFAPDIVLAHSINGIIFANKLGCKFSIAIHASDMKLLENPIFKFYYRSEFEKACKKSERIAFPSIILKEKFLNKYPQYKKKCFVAPCGINSDNVNKRIWLEEEKSVIKVVVYNEKLKQKNLEKFINICENNKRIELTVIANIKKIPENIPNNLYFVGEKHYQEILQNCEESDIFICLNENESFGKIYLDAMAKGCITVCLKNTGIDGILKDSVNGFVGEDIESTLERVIDFPDKNWILNNGFETVLNLSEDNVAVHYMNCLAGYSSKI